MEKFKILAAGNGRSVNKEIEMLMRRAVQEYEREHGPIAVPARTSRSLPTSSVCRPVVGSSRI